jgi:hypothetical protein
MQRRRHRDLVRAQRCSIDASARLAKLRPVTPHWANASTSWIWRRTSGSFAWASARWNTCVPFQPQELQRQRPRRHRAAVEQHVEVVGRQLDDLVSDRVVGIGEARVDPRFDALALDRSAFEKWA